MEWQQATSSMYFSGAYKYIRLFDVNKECQVMDIPTGSDGCITSLNTDTQMAGLVVSACSDGYVRVFDSRASASSRYPPSPSCAEYCALY